MKDAIEFIETYCQEYISYLVHFFFHGLDKAEDSSEVAPTYVTFYQNNSKKNNISQNVFVYGTMSLVVGTALQEVSVSHLALKDVDFLGRGTMQGAFWLAITLAIFGFLKLINREVVFSEILNATLQVLPPAFLIGAFAGLLAYYYEVIHEILFTNKVINDENLAQTSSIVDTIVQAVLIVVYTSIVLKKYCRGNILVSIAISVIVVIFVGEIGLVFTFKSMIERDRKNMIANAHAHSESSEVKPPDTGINASP